MVRMLAELPAGAFVPLARNRLKRLDEVSEAITILILSTLEPIFTGICRSREFENNNVLASEVECER